MYLLLRVYVILLSKYVAGKNYRRNISVFKSTFNEFVNAQKT